MTAEVVLSHKEIQAAKRRIAAEAAKADEETRKKRLARKKALVGEIETVEAGKGGVREGLRQFFHKGRTWETETGGPVAIPVAAPPPTKPWGNNKTDQPTGAAAAAATTAPPAREPVSVPGRTHADQKQVFENEEKAVPSLFAGRRRGANKQQQQQQEPPANGGGAAAAAAPTAAEREAMDKLRPSGWDGKTYYSLTDLRQRKTPKIDMKNREQYLAPDEFRSAFGMTKGAFCSLPKWKRDRLKQSLYLH